MKNMSARTKLISLAGVALLSTSLMGAPVSSASSASIAQAPQAPPAPEPPTTPRVAPRAETFHMGSGVGIGVGQGSYLGVDVQEVTPERMSALKLKEERGVEIVMVDQDAPAGKAGLKEHDVILDFNGNRVEGQEQLVRMLRETPGGRQVTLGIVRDGQPMQIKVTLGDRRKIAKFNYHVMPAMPAMPAMPDFDLPSVEVIARSYSRSTGMMVDNLTPQLGEFFGVKSGQGVLVRSVEKGSAAEAAGLKAGDVIVKVDAEKIADRNDFSRALRNRNGAKLSLGVVREKREQTLTLTLPERRSRNESRVMPYVVQDSSDFDFDFDFDTSELDELKDELPKIKQEMERIGPQIQRELERVRQEITRTVAEQVSSCKRAEGELQRSKQQINRKLRKMNSHAPQVFI